MAEEDDGFIDDIDSAMPSDSLSTKGSRLSPTHLNQTIRAGCEDGWEQRDTCHVITSGNVTTVISDVARDNPKGAEADGIKLEEALSGAKAQIGDKKPAQILVPMTASKTMPSFLTKIPFIGKLIENSKLFKRAHFTTLEVNIGADGKVSATHVDSAGKRIGGLYNTDHIKEAVQRVFPQAEYKDVYTGHQPPSDGNNCGRFSIDTIVQRIGKASPIAGPQDIAKPSQETLERVDAAIETGKFTMVQIAKHDNVIPTPQPQRRSQSAPARPAQKDPPAVAAAKRHNSHPPHSNVANPPAATTQIAAQTKSTGHGGR